MSITYRIIYFSLLLLSLITSSSQVYANEKDPCPLFNDADIDHSLISRMLDAAGDVHLYRVKTDSSKMWFCVKSPVGMVNGSLKKFQGGIALKEPDNQTVISVDMSSIETDTLFIKKLLKSDNFFNIKDFPEIVFVSSGFEWLSNNKAVIKGRLSMRGVTKLVAFYVEITEIDDEPDVDESICIKATNTI